MFFLFLFFFFACCVVLFSKECLQAYLALLRPLDFEKKKRTHKHGSTVRVKIADCFNVFCKILLQSIFVVRIINKNKNKSMNSKISGTNSEATSGHSGASLKHSRASRILYFALRGSNKPKNQDLACLILSRNRCITS